MATLRPANQLARDTLAPPYLPFARFVQSLDALAVYMPPRIERALWSNESPYLATVLVNAYAFLKLIDAEGAPASVLRRLATDVANRPAILRQVLQHAYGDVLHGAEIDRALSGYHVTGATHRKAVSFLVQACRYAGLPVPRALTENIRSSHSRSMPAAQQPAETTTITVTLESGGEITLSGRVNPFTLSSDDRRFLFRLVDELNAYKAKHPAAEATALIEEEEVPF